MMYGMYINIEQGTEGQTKRKEQETKKTAHKELKNL
jgi:hypothetical protein